MEALQNFFGENLEKLIELSSDPIKAKENVTLSYGDLIRLWNFAIESGSPLKILGYRELHYAMWDYVCSHLQEVALLKKDCSSEDIIRACKDLFFFEKGLKIPNSYCYACESCSTTCDNCPLIDSVGRCWEETSSYARLNSCLQRGTLEAAIKEAKRIRDAWN